MSITIHDSESRFVYGITPVTTDGIVKFARDLILVHAGEYAIVTTPYASVKVSKT